MDKESNKPFPGGNDGSVPPKDLVKSLISEKGGPVVPSNDPEGLSEGKTEVKTEGKTEGGTKRIGGPPMIIAHEHRKTREAREQEMMTKVSFWAGVLVLACVAFFYAVMYSSDGTGNMSESGKFVDYALFFVLLFITFRFLTTFAAVAVIASVAAYHLLARIHYRNQPAPMGPSGHHVRYFMGMFVACFVGLRLSYYLRGRAGGGMKEPAEGAATVVKAPPAGAGGAAATGDLDRRSDVSLGQNTPAGGGKDDGKGSLPPPPAPTPGSDGGKNVAPTEEIKENGP